MSGEVSKAQRGKGTKYKSDKGTEYFMLVYARLRLQCERAEMRVCNAQIRSLALKQSTFKVKGRYL